MVKSIQHFNEKSIPIFEKLEDEFLKDLSDIVSYVKKITEELHKTGIRMIEEKKVVKALFIDADEAHISLQYRNKKGDLVKNDRGRKNNHVIEKLVYCYEGIEEEAPGSKRHKLINPHYFCSDSASEDNKDFWERIYAYIDSHYDMGQIEKIYVNGDGGTWMEEGKTGMAGVIVTMDEFHLQKYLIKITSHLMDSRFDAISELRKIIMHKNKTDFNGYVDFVKTYLKEDDVKRAESIEDGRDYILNNWMPCKVRLSNRKKLCINHHISGL